MPSNLGGTSIGFFLATPTLPRKRGECSICTLGTGKGIHLAPRITSSAPMKRPVFKRAAGAIPVCPRARAREAGEHEYERGGPAILGGLGCPAGLVMGRCEPATGIEPFGRLVTQVMEQEPYRRAERVFWVVDNGSSHRGQATVRRLAQAYANLIVVHTPVHASWLNQVEIYFSIVQRKVLTPNDFASLEDVEQRLRLYEALSNRQPRPFAWKFTRTKLTELLKRLEAYEAMRDQGDAAQVASDSAQREPLAA